MGGAPGKGGAGRGDVPALSSESGGLRGGVQLQGEAGAALMKAANLYAWPEGTGGLSGTPSPRWQWSLPPTSSLGTVWGQCRPFLAPLQGPRHTDLHTPSQCLLMPSAIPRFCHSYNTPRFRWGLDQGPRGAGASGRPSTHPVWLFTSPWGGRPWSLMPQVGGAGCQTNAVRGNRAAENKARWGRMPTGLCWGPSVVPPDLEPWE